MSHELQKGSMPVIVGKARIKAKAQEMHDEVCGCGEPVNYNWLERAEKQLVKQEREKKVAKRLVDPGSV